MSVDWLFVSFWDVALANFPADKFRRHGVDADTAGALIANARGQDRLRCVSSIDLVAPYNKRHRTRHGQLCHALRDAGILLDLVDFIGDSFCNPLEFARVEQGKCLLVVDCSFQIDFEPLRGMTTDADGTDRVKLKRSVLSDTISFHLFEAI